MAKRTALVSILYAVGKVLSILPIILMTCLLVLGVVGLVMLFLVTGTDWKTFGLLINRDIAGIVYGMLLGIASIVAWVGFFKKKEWARKVSIGICIIYTVITFLNFARLAIQGVIVTGHIQNFILHIFYGLFGIYLLNHRKIKKWFSGKKYEKSSE